MYVLILIKQRTERQTAQNQFWGFATSCKAMDRDCCHRFCCCQSVGVCDTPSSHNGAKVFMMLFMIFLFINEFNEIIVKDQTLNKIEMQLQNAFEHIMSFGIAFIALTGFAGPSELEGRSILADTLILFTPRGQVMPITLLFAPLDWY